MTKPPGSSCNCVRLRMNRSRSAPLWFEIDQRMIRENDVGDYRAVIWLRDEYYETSHLQSVFTIDFSIEYEHSVFVSYQKNTGIDARPRRNITVEPKKKVYVDPNPAWLTKEDTDFKVAKDGSVYITPQLGNQRTAAVVDQKKVDSVIEAFNTKVLPNATEKARLESEARIARPKPVELNIKRVTSDGKIHLEFSEELHVPPFRPAGWRKVVYDRDENRTAR